MARHSDDPNVKQYIAPDGSYHEAHLDSLTDIITNTDLLSDILTALEDANNGGTGGNETTDTGETTQQLLRALIMVSKAQTEQQIMTNNLLKLILS